MFWSTTSYTYNFSNKLLFLPRLFLNASRANHSEFQPCIWFAKSTARLETVFLFFSETDRSFEEKLHGVCTLTKVYQYAKEERFLFFEPCRTLVDMCMELLLVNPSRSTIYYYFKRALHLTPIQFSFQCGMRFLSPLGKSSVAF